MQETASNAELKHMTKREYRDYMAQRDRVRDPAAHRKADRDPSYSPFSGRPEKKYYARFDRGAARYARRKAKRSRSRK